MSPSALALAAVIALSGPAAAIEDGAMAQLGRMAGFSDELRFAPTSGGVRVAGGAAGAQGRIDHGWQWGPNLSRNQGPLGACTAFATVALYEAASARDSRGGMCIRLSEGDLYMQALVAGMPCWSDPRRSCGAGPFGFSLTGMNAFLRERGVLTGDGYEGAVRRYLAATAAELRESPLFNPLGFVAGERPLDRLTKGQFVSFFGRNLVARATIARESIRARLKRYRVVEHIYWEALRQRSWTMTPAQCAAGRLRQEAFLDAELAAGRPVAVAMFVGGLPAWGHVRGQAVNQDGHAFVIKGVEHGRGGKHYTTRNSWGGVNPHVYPDQLCRVVEAVSLLGPGER